MAASMSSAGKRRFVHIAQKLLEQVQRGEFKEGDRLPPDRMLATYFAVSRATVREALLALELLGVIEIRHGSGVYVTTGGEGSTIAVHDWFTPSTTSLFEARTAVEPKIAKLCATRMSSVEIKATAASITQARRIVESGGEYAAFTDVQLDFHMRLVDGCKNPILADINRHLMSVEEHPLWALLNQRVLNTSQDRLQQVLEHRKILDHIKARRADEAAEAMRSHLTDLGCALVGTSWVS